MRFWKHFSYPGFTSEPLPPSSSSSHPPQTLGREGRCYDYAGFCFHPHSARMVWISKKFKMWQTERGRYRERDAVKVRREVVVVVGEQKAGSWEQDRLNRGCNAVGVESVTQLIACWWLRVVSAVSSPWFMDSRWTPAGSEVGEGEGDHSLTTATGPPPQHSFFFLPAEQRKTERGRQRLHFFPIMPDCFARQLAVSSFSLPRPEE